MVLPALIVIEPVVVKLLVSTTLLRGLAEVSRVMLGAVSGIVPVVNVPVVAK